MPRSGTWSGPLSFAWLAAVVLAVYASPSASAADDDGTRDKGIMVCPRSGEAVSSVYGVFVGVSVYQQEELNLQYAHQDAIALHRLFTKQFSAVVPAEHFAVLTNRLATKRGILKAVKEALDRAFEDDLVVLSFSMHGLLDPEGENLYFLAHDTDPTELWDRGIGRTEILRMIRKSKARKIVLLLDACNSGGFGSAGSLLAYKGVEAADVNRLLGAMGDARSGVAVITSSSAAERSREGDRYCSGHGVFTCALLDALKGKADANGNGLMELREVYDYIYFRVKADTGGAQNPSIEGQFDNDLPLTSSLISNDRRALTIMHDDAESPLVDKTGGGHALPALEEQCSAGEARSCLLAAQLHLVNGSLASAQRLAADLCHPDHPEGCLIKAYVLREYGKEREAVETAAATKKSAIRHCGRKKMLSCAVVGDVLLDFENSPDKAKGMYQKSCDGEELLGCAFLGSMLYFHRDNVGAEPYLRETCQAGFAQSCNLVGLLYRLRNRLSEATEAFAAGCRLGHVISCAEVGWQADRDGDPATADEYMKKACDGSQANGCRQAAAYRLFKGERTEAEVLAANACATGSVRACLDLAQHFTGRKPANFALPVLRQGCENGQAYACYGVGLALELLGRMEDAKASFQSACDEGYSPACVFMIGLDKGPDGRIPEEHHQTLTEACDAGDPQGCVLLANHANAMGEHGEAEAYYRNACNELLPATCGSLGGFLYQRGDKDAAWPYIEKGCAIGDAVACYWKGAFLSRSGRFEEAAEAYKTSCDAGNLYACGDLGNQYLGMGNVRKAEYLCNKACTDRTAYGCTCLGHIQIQRQQYGKAKQTCTRTCDTELGGLSQWGCACLALALEAEGAFDEAHETLTAVCDKGIPETCMALAGHLMRRSRFDEAEPYLLSACAVDNGEACYNLAAVYFNTNRQELVEELVRKSCSLGYPWACKELGQ